MHPVDVTGSCDWCKSEDIEYLAPTYTSLHLFHCKKCSYEFVRVVDSATIAKLKGNS